MIQSMQDLMKLLLQPLSGYRDQLCTILVIVIIVVLIKECIKYKEYKKGTYYQVTKLPYYSVMHDKGKYGEYLTYKYLKNFEAGGAKLLFNVYIPKENGETTEIDVLMISKKGIFVFESKNYSGWIFGSEGQKNWYQTIREEGRRRSHKESFYNPIMQNRSHIKHLEAFLGEQVPMHSIIVFSDRCTLKKVQVKSKDISVINRYDVESVVSNIYKEIPDDLLSKNDIADLYNKLYPCTQVDDAVKTQHIINIKNNLGTQNVKQTAENVTSDLSAENSEDSTEQYQAEKPETVSDDTVKMERTVEKDMVLEAPKDKEVEPDAEKMKDEDVKSDTEETKDEDVKSDTEETEDEDIESDAEEQQSLKCPKCGKALALRTAKRGANKGKQFYGCSGYPKCRYIQELNEDL